MLRFGNNVRVETGQFNHIKVPPPCYTLAAIFLWGRIMKASRTEVCHFTGSQLDNRKLFPRGLHSY